MMRKIAALILCVLCLPVAAIDREDVLECRVSDGSKFLLKSKYEWSPLSRFYRHAAERINQEPYSIYYRGNHSPLLSDTKHTVGHSNNKSEFADICSTVGLFRGRPVVTYMYFEDGHWVGLTPENEVKLYVQPARVHQSEQVRNELQQLHRDGRSAVPKLNHAFVTPMDKRLVFEHPVTRDGEVVVAVFKSESFDNGKTWQDLKLTTDADIFEVGKRLVDQSFVGQPYRFNGKKIE